MEYSRRVERGGRPEGNGIFSRNRREDRQRKAVFQEFARSLEERESSRERSFDEENPREEASPSITPDQVRNIVKSLQQFEENPRGLLEMHTPPEASFREEERSGRWVDSRG